MGKCKTTNKGGANLQKGASPFPSLQDGEASDTAQDPVDKIAAMEEVLSHLGTSPKTPFRFWRTRQSPLERSVSPEH